MQCVQCVHRERVRVRTEWLTALRRTEPQPCSGTRTWTSARVRARPERPVTRLVGRPTGRSFVSGERNERLGKGVALLTSAEEAAKKGRATS